jgi:hypothetical protein
VSIRRSPFVEEVSGEQNATETPKGNH